MGWTGGTEKLGFDEGLLSDNEIRGWDAPGVSRALVAELSFGDGSLEFLVQFVEIDHKVFSTGGCEVALGMDGKVRVITLVRKERRDPRSSTRSIVVCKFRKRK